VDGYCIESDISNHCGGGFTPGVFYDGSKLWLLASADAAGQFHGIYSIEPGTSTTTTFRPGKLALSGKFDIIARGPGGTAWAIGLSGTGARFDGSSWVTSSTGITIDQAIAGAVVADDGQVWVAGYRSIVHFDGKSWQKLTEPGMPEGGSSIAVTHDGTAYVVKEGHLFRRKP
jgi:hypothetical protein